jgi:glyoxylase-like metal-dependent hydrolase (beta-lactamase superfamily II)
MAYRSQIALINAALMLGTVVCEAQLRCDAPRNPVFAKYQKLDAADGWFEVYRLPHNVYALWEPRQAEHVFSYLIVGEKRALLFDSGFGIGKIDKVVQKLTDLPVVVLNSHTHYDHVGGNYAFTEIYGSHSDYTRANEHGYPNSKMAASLAPGQFCPPLPEGVSPEDFVIRPFRVTHEVADGDTIDLGGRILEVIATPGHTPDSVCLLDRGNRELFTGDTFYPGSIWLWVPETDLDAYQRSIERIAKLTEVVDVLRPGHGLPEAAPAMLEKVAHALPEARAGKVPYTINTNRRVYRFDGFSISLAR